MTAIVFDIETGPLPVQHLRSIGAITPVDPQELAAKRPPDVFDESTVKPGNLKDAAKVAAKIEEARAAHAATLAEFDAGFPAMLEQEQQRREREVVSRAALKAETGRVLAIGYWRGDVSDGDQFHIDGEQSGADDEPLVIERFWKRYHKLAAAKAKLVGFNIHGFDLPFLVRRSYILGVTVPESVLVQGRYWSDTFVDLMARWQCGQFRDQYIKLDTLARCLGLPGKNGDGAEFARLWLGSEEERQQAVAYLRNDLVMTAEVGKRLGVV